MPELRERHHLCERRQGPGRGAHERRGVRVLRGWRRPPLDLEAPAPRVLLPALIPDPRLEMWC